MTDPTQQAPGPETAAGRRTILDFEEYVANVPHDNDFAVGGLLDAIRRDRQSSLDQIRGAVRAIEAEARAQGAAARDAEVAARIKSAVDEVRRRHVRSIPEGPDAFDAAIGDALNDAENRVRAALAAEPVSVAPVAVCPAPKVHHHQIASGMSVQFQPGHLISDVPEQYRDAPAAPVTAEGLDASLLAEALWAWGYDATGPVIRDEVKEPTEGQHRMARKLATEYDRRRAARLAAAATPPAETGE